MNILPVIYLISLSFFGFKPNVVTPCYFKTSIGMDVPHFEFTTVEGKSMRISDFKGKLVLISLFGTRCPPCIKEMPHIHNEIYKKYKGEDFIILSIGATDTQDELMAFKQKTDYPFTFVPDPNQEIFELFADCMIPRNVLVDAEGKIVFQSVEFNKTPFERMVKIIGEELTSIR